ncbi:MgtC/SapB family protein [Sulfuritalea hydrogenivorans]|uniref:MgtC/SapB transporter n=1 Tax=Sulfuritalea hydrogenivorans sk43H TaxID=1223802 RepID=W0SFM1_9PROT|nr:MgtC/SapB family protein [Sulfuritalea hydrogenivorans]BAO29565.1 MgtC/SapB transporter [Sulfuritalea hydrogenivorans sk43H]
MFASDAGYETLQAFATSIGIGLLIGLERERQVDLKAGLRTFALVGLLGCLSALLAQITDNGWILAAGMLAIAAMMIAAHVSDPLDTGDPGTTSVVALMVCFALGAVVWFGYASTAVMLAIATTVLLYFKAELHGISKSLTHVDLLSILQFGILALVILPILPDRSFGPYQALNPHNIWWMVVLISGVSLAGYAALRMTGAQHGAALIGLFGGFASSTATTMIFARHARANAGLARTAMVVILLANIVVMVRLGVLSFAVAPNLAGSLLGVLGGGIVLGIAATLWGWRQLEGGDALPMPNVTNPTEIRTAVTFGALYALVLVLSAWLQDVAGNRGLYLLALASGLTDVDAITLSSLRMFSLEKLTAAEAITAITLATISNLAFKTGLVVVIGGTALARLTLPGLCAIAAGLAGGLLLV